MRSPRALALLIGGIALITSACGTDDNDDSSGAASSTTMGEQPGRSVDIDMVDDTWTAA